jgi:hypothetical protein
MDRMLEVTGARGGRDMVANEEGTRGWANRKYRKRIDVETQKTSNEDKKLGGGGVKDHSEE